MYQRGSHWTDFRETCYSRYYEKNFDKFQILLKSGKSIGHFTWTPRYVFLFPATIIAIQVLSASEIFSGSYDNQGLANIMRTRQYATLYAHCLFFSLPFLLKSIPLTIQFSKSLELIFSKYSTLLLDIAGSTEKSINNYQYHVPEAKFSKDFIICTLSQILVG